MPSTSWTIGEFIQARGITPYALAQASKVRKNTVYRICTPGQEPSRVDIPTITALITGLRMLTGEEVGVQDLLTYHED